MTHARRPGRRSTAADALRRLADDRFDVARRRRRHHRRRRAPSTPPSRGLRTALVERDDFASGTSSKSSKLVHGGLRYLQQGEIRLVYEALARAPAAAPQRPHLVKRPAVPHPDVHGKDGVINPKLARALGSAMWMYDLTGGARIGKLHSASRRTRRWPTCRRCPATAWPAAYLYYDAQADDARLTLTIARTAAIDHGAAVANGARLVGLAQGRRRPGRAAPPSRPTASAFDVALLVPSSTPPASGPTTSAPSTRARTPTRIRPAKGIHITVPWDMVRNDIAVVVPVPKDKRSVFVVPWGDLTYIGTTDTDYDGPLDDPQCTPEDIDYLLRAINFSTAGTITERRRHRHVGRPAAAGEAAPSSGRTADLSRRHQVDAVGRGVVTVTGGKLTTYREMAADTVDEVRRGRSATGSTGRSPAPAAPSSCGSAAPTGYDAAPIGGDERAAHLADRYGGEARDRAGHDRGGPGARRAAGRRAPLPAGRGRVRGPLRDGPHASTTC